MRQPVRPDRLRLDPPVVDIVDAATAAPAWAPGRLPPAGVDGGRLFTAGAGELRTFPADGCGAATCAPTWQAPLPPGQVTVGGEVVAIGDTEQGLDVDRRHGCGAPTCEPLRSFDLPYGTAVVIVAGGRVHATADDALHVYAPADRTSPSGAAGAG